MYPSHLPLFGAHARAGSYECSLTTVVLTSSRFLLPVALAPGAFLFGSALGTRHLAPYDINVKYLIGVDEVGRGPIAGPVAACALACLDPDVLASFSSVRDSKQLSEKQRESWLEKIKTYADAGRIRYTVAFQSERVIDTVNIRQATLLAVFEAIHTLKLPATDSRILLDGGLVAPQEFLDQETIIGGDALVPIVAMASIVAKVMRDRLMKELGTQYPGYGFEDHKGYGTRGHYAAIGKYGVLPVHRRSFLKEIEAFT